VTAGALIRLLLAYAPPQLPRTDVVGIAGTPIALAVGVTLAAVLVFAVLPAMLASSGQLASPLRYDSRAGTETRARRRVRHALVASQVALALVMLAGAALLGRSLERLQGLSLGYNPDHLSLLATAFPPSVYNDSAGKFDQHKTNALADQLVPAYRAVPGVMAVTPALVPPSSAPESSLAGSISKARQRKRPRRTRCIRWKPAAATTSAFTASRSSGVVRSPTRTTTSRAGGGGERDGSEAYLA
jgi:hypothetical protein